MSTLSQTDNFDPFACGGRNDEITTVTALNSAGEPVQIRLGMGAQPEVLAAADPPNRSEAMLLEEITSAPSIENETVSHAGAAPAERGPSVRITDPHLKAAADLFATWYVPRLAGGRTMFRMRSITRRRQRLSSGCTA